MTCPTLAEPTRWIEVGETYLRPENLKFSLFPYEAQCAISFTPSPLPFASLSSFPSLPLSHMCIYTHLSIYLSIIYLKQCGGLNENGSYLVKYKCDPQLVGTLQEGLGGMALFMEVQHWEQPLKSQKIHAIPSVCSPLPVSGLTCELSAIPATTSLHNYCGHQPSETISPNYTASLKVALAMVSYHSNRKETKTDRVSLGSPSCHRIFYLLASDS